MDLNTMSESNLQVRANDMEIREPLSKHLFLRMTEETRKGYDRLYCMNQIGIQALDLDIGLMSSSQGAIVGATFGDDDYSSLEQLSASLEKESLNDDGTFSLCFWVHLLKRSKTGVFILQVIILANTSGMQQWVLKISES